MKVNVPNGKGGFTTVDTTSVSAPTVRVSLWPRELRALTVFAAEAFLEKVRKISAATSDEDIKELQADAARRRPDDSADGLSRHGVLFAPGRAGFPAILAVLIINCYRMNLCRAR